MLAQIAGTVLDSPITWGVIGLVGVALAVGGKFSATAANLLLLGAGMVGCFGLYRAFGFQDWRPFAVSSLFLAGVLVLVSLWISPPLKASVDTEQSKLTMQIIHTTLGNHPPSPNAWAIVAASVYNQGTPTIADQWALDVELLDHKKVHGLGGYIKPDRPVEFQYEDGIESWSPDDVLYEKTIKPIPSGDKVVGFLIYELPGVTMEAVAKSGTRFTLFCKDVTGHIVKADHIWEEGSSVRPQLYYPGMKPPKFTPRDSSSAS